MVDFGKILEGNWSMHVLLVPEINEELCGCLAESILQVYTSRRLEFTRV
jgi:hypothetical protein